METIGKEHVCMHVTKKGSWIVEDAILAIITPKAGFLQIKTKILSILENLES
jgi:hypothetical protein